MNGVTVKTLASLMILLILIQLSSISVSEAQTPLFRLERLTVPDNIYSIDVFDGGVVGVGENGLIMKVYMDGGRSVEYVGGKLLDVSCLKEYCMAVGEKGLAVIIDLKKDALKRIELPTLDYFKVVGSGTSFYIASREVLLEYSIQDGRVLGEFRETINDVDVKDNGDLIILGREYLKSLSGENIPLKNVGRVKSIVYPYLVGDGLYFWNGTSLIKVLEQGFDRAVKTNDGLLLSSRGFIYYWSREKGLVSIGYSGELNDIAYGNGRIYVAGKGYIAELKDGVKMLIAPSSSFSDSSSDNGLAIVVGKDVLLYRDGYLEKIQAPVDEYYSASLSGSKAIILGKKNTVILDVSSRSFTTIPEISGLGVNDVSLYGLKAYIASDKGFFEVDLEQRTSRQLSQGRFYKASYYGAVGEKTLTVLTPASVENIKINYTGRGVDGYGCTLIAVGDKGSITFYRNGFIEHLKAGDSKLTAVGAGRYVLIGDESGKLYFSDGYRVENLPYSLGEEVKSISWIGGNEALIVTSNNIYRLVVEKHLEPAVILDKPSNIRMYNGTGKTVNLILKPLYGFSGKLPLTVTVEGIEGVSARIDPQEVYVKEMCPETVKLEIDSAGWVRGSGYINIIYGNSSDRIPLIVEPSTQTPQKTGVKLFELLLPVAPIVILLSILIALYMKLRAKPRKKSVETPQKEERKEEPEEGGEEEW